MKHTAKYLLLVLVLTLAFTLCACGEETKPQEDDTTVTTTEAVTTTTTAPQKTAAFQVTVLDNEGNPVKGVMVQLCKENCVPKITDENGIAAFDVEITDGYKLSVSSCPAGYTYTGEAEIYLESGATAYTLELQREA